MKKVYGYLVCEKGDPLVCCHCGAPATKWSGDIPIQVNTTRLDRLYCCDACDPHNKWFGLTEEDRAEIARSDQLSKGKKQ